MTVKWKLPGRHTGKLMAELELTPALLPYSPVLAPVFHAHEEVVLYSVGGKGYGFGSNNFYSKKNMENSLLE